MKKNEISTLISQLSNPERCWDAMLDIKFINGKEIHPFLLKHLQDDHAVIRWVIAEKCADISFYEAIPLLFDLLKDNDQQVRKTAFKALKSMSKNSLPLAIKIFLEDDETLHAACSEIIKINGKGAFDELKLHFTDVKIKNGRRFIELLWSLSPFNVESLLIECLNYPALFKESLIYLHKIKSITAVPTLLIHYRNPDYRAIIDSYFSKLQQDQLFDILAETLIDPELGPIAQDIVCSYGKIVLPYIQSKIQVSNFEAKLQWVAVLQTLKESQSFHKNERR